MVFSGWGIIFEIMEKISIIWQTVLESFHLTLGFSILFFGSLIIFGLLLHKLARLTRSLFAQSIGRKPEIFVTGWIGTPIHELGHAFFCLIFFHRITKISLFKPNSIDGSLGSVEHKYNPQNLYHQVGNFFIGVGPLIFGALMIIALGYLLLPSEINFVESVFKDMPTSQGKHAPLRKIIEFFGYLFLSLKRSMISDINYAYWQYWLFIYLSLAISSHMEISKSDLESMLIGLLVIFIHILFTSFILLLFFIDYYFLIEIINSVVRFLAKILFVSLGFSVINFLITWILLTILGTFIKGEPPNPFTR
jgi:hypothetical protein